MNDKYVKIPKEEQPEPESKPKRICTECGYEDGHERWCRYRDKPEQEARPGIHDKDYFGLEAWCKRNCKGRDQGKHHVACKHHVLKAESEQLEPEGGCNHKEMLKECDELFFELRRVACSDTLAKRIAHIHNRVAASLSTSTTRCKDKPEPETRSCGCVDQCKETGVQLSREPLSKDNPRLGCGCTDDDPRECIKRRDYDNPADIDPCPCDCHNHEPEVYRVEELEGKLTRMVKWLEDNQPDVFSRGIWDAIRGEPEQEEKRCNHMGGGWDCILPYGHSGRHEYDKPEPEGEQPATMDQIGASVTCMMCENRFHGIDVDSMGGDFVCRKCRQLEQGAETCGQAVNGKPCCLIVGHVGEHRQLVRIE